MENDKDVIIMTLCIKFYELLSNKIILFYQEVFFNAQAFYKNDITHKEFFSSFQFV